MKSLGMLLLLCFPLSCAMRVRPITCGSIPCNSPYWYKQTGVQVVTSEGSVPQHGEYDITVKDIVTILAEFDVKHVEQQPFFAPAYGVTDFSSSPPAIWIFNKSDTRDKRSTVIHELLHAHYREIGVNVSEEFIAMEEERNYNKVFGVIN